MHPFFASRKMNKCANQDQDVINIENMNGLCDSERDPPFYPIHVVYQSEVCQANACFVYFLRSYIITRGQVKRNVFFCRPVYRSTGVIG